MPRFTVRGDSELDGLIERHLEAIRDEISSQLPHDAIDCLALGGGYGRGEGGALLRDGCWCPYNDYDLVLVHGSDDERRVRESAADIHRRFSAAFGVHVDVLPLHRSRIERLPPALTWYEFGQGHVVVAGDGMCLEPLRRRRLEDVDDSEWGRLLVNRACGLVFARWLLAGESCDVVGEEDPDDFVTRQIYKAWLALGDVVLASQRRYHHLVRFRSEAWDDWCERRGTRAPWWHMRYREAVDFKLQPFRLDARGIQIHMAELTGCYREALRLRPSSPARPGVGVYATLRHLPPRVWLRSAPWRYPRERLRLALGAELDDRPDLRRRYAGEHADLVRLWERYG